MKIVEYDVVEWGPGSSVGGIWGKEGLKALLANALQNHGMELHSMVPKPGDPELLLVVLVRRE